MLVLTRKSGERIVIGKDIVITVLKSCGDRVRLGVSAPTNIAVDREEIFVRRLLETAATEPESLEGPRSYAECP